MLPALLASAAKSAPTNPGVDLAIFRRLKDPSNLRVLVTTERISSLAFSTGTYKAIPLSKRPGLLYAGSMASGLFVAPITRT